MKWRKLNVLGIAVFIMTLPAAAQNEDNKATPSIQEEMAPSPKKEIVVQPLAGDQQIAKRLRGILVATGWFTEPEVTVREGVVFLDGATTQDLHRAWAASLAERMQDVVAVVNRIEVRPTVQWDFGFAQAEVQRLYWQFAQALPLILLACLTLLVSWVASIVVASLARRMLGLRISSPVLLTLVVRVIAISVFTLGLYFVLEISNLTRLALTILGGTGIVGLALGFAFRDIAENFLASLVLSLRNPFRTGDYISVDGTEGIVQNLNTRTTVLLTLDGNYIQIPNATVFKNKITNYSSNPYRRSEFMVGIGYECSIVEAQDLILKVLMTHSAVLPSPEPLVLVDQLSAAAVNLRCLYWFDSKTYSPIKIKSALLRLTKRALLEAGISLPDDAREVIFPQGVPVVRFMERDLQATIGLDHHVAPMPNKSETKERATESEGGLFNDEKEIALEVAKSGQPFENESLLEDDTNSTVKKRNVKSGPGVEQQ